MSVPDRRIAFTLLVGLAVGAINLSTRGAEGDADTVGPSAANIPAPPEGFATRQDLQAYLQQVQGSGGKSQESRVAVLKAQIAAAEIFLGGRGPAGAENPRSDADRAEVSEQKLGVLQYLLSLGDDSVADKLADSLEAARSDDSPLVRDVAWRHGVRQELDRWPELDGEDASALLTRIAEGFKTREATGGQLRFLFQTLFQLDLMASLDTAANHGEQGHARQLFALLDGWLPEQSDDPKKQDLLEAIATVRRRVELPGQPFELSGKLLDGSDFDASAHRGRVVLVDFWALWCVNCYKDAPEYTRLYNKYHDKGFDFVSVSLDDNPEDAAAYLKKAGLPDCPTIIGTSPETIGFSHPLAVRCGVIGIPFSFVIDRKGVVACVNVKGEALEQVIRDQLSKQ